MPLHPSLADIALRLAPTLIASGLIGLDRESQHHPAGLRTTILVGLAATLFGLRRLEQKWMRVNRAILTIRVSNRAASTEVREALAA